jgi:DNA primase
VDEVAQIKERLNIEDVISSYLTLKKAGSNLKANCPFHNEKTPSFMVSPERQSFKCFGCGEGGDIFTFVEKIEGVDFYNALKILADRAGVKLQPRKIRYGEKEYAPDINTKLYEINDWAARLFHQLLLKHPKAKTAREYLQKRGIKMETIERFRIGFAPESWDYIIKFLTNKSYSKEEIFKAGLLVRNEKGDYYDRFRGRIMFPINNVIGNCIAFTSRVLMKDDKGAKYLNSADSPVYHKGKVLYGLDLAKMEIKSADLAVLVEGNMDVIACHQAGFRNVVASSGTATTAEQLKILSRYASVIAFSFDSDSAGEAAMKRTVALALENDINTKIISLPAAFKDPDEAIKSDPKNWQRAVAEAKPALEYWIDLLIRKTPDLSVINKKKIAKEILPVIKLAFSEIEQEHYVKYLAGKLSVSEKSLSDAIDKVKGEGRREKGEEEELHPKRITDVERLAGLIWGDGNLTAKVRESVDMIILNTEDKRLEKLFTGIKSGELNRNKFSQDMVAYFEQLALWAEGDFEDSKDSRAKIEEIEFILAKLKQASNEQMKSDFARRISEAEKAGDQERIKALLKEFSELIK